MTVRPVLRVLLVVGCLAATTLAPAQPASLLPSSRTGGRAGGAALPTAPSGGFVAAHFAGRLTGPALAAHARLLAERGPELAGVRHVLIVAAAEPQARAAVAGLGDAAPRVVADADGALASTIARAALPADGSNAGFPLTVLLDERGQAVQTLRGGEGEWVPLESLAAQVTLRNRAARPDLVRLASNVAADGYDVVSYRDPGGPKLGSPTITSSWQGITYQFANAATRRRFADDPAALVPAVGGWGAAAMAEGERVAPSPTTFLLVDGTLCLFSAGTAPEVLERWRTNGRAELGRAQAQWRRLGGG